MLDFGNDGRRTTMRAVAFLLLVVLGAGVGAAHADPRVATDATFTICVAGAACTGAQSLVVSGVTFTLTTRALPASGFCMPSVPQRHFAFTLNAFNTTAVAKTVQTKGASLRTDGLPDWANASAARSSKVIPAGTAQSFEFESDCNDGTPWGGQFQLNVQPDGGTSSSLPSPPTGQTCTGGRRWTGRSCQCPLATPLLSDGKCTACPKATPSWNGSSCVACPQGTRWNGQSCACPPNSQWHGGACCPASTPAWNGTACEACPKGTHWSGRSCDCPTATPTWNGFACCPTATPAWDGSSCVPCAANAHFNGKSCECDLSAPVWNGRTCSACSGGSQWNGSSCVCPTSAPIVVRGTCTPCPAATPAWNGSACSTCANGLLWNGSACVCPSGEHWTNNQCEVCLGGSVWSGSQCLCPAGTTWNGGACLGAAPSTIGLRAGVRCSWSGYGMNKRAVMQCFNRVAGDCQWPDSNGNDNTAANAFLDCYQGVSGGTDSDAALQCCRAMGGACYRSPQQYAQGPGDLCQ